MTNLLATAIIWFHTNYLDSAVDSRGDGMLRTNIVTTIYALPLPHFGWITNTMTMTNVGVMRLKWVEVGRWAEATKPQPDLPPVPPSLYVGTNQLTGSTNQTK